MLICNLAGGDARLKINRLHKIARAAGEKNPTIVLLQIKEVVQWLFGDLSFLAPAQNNLMGYKLAEDEWGRKAIKCRRPDFKSQRQWTSMLGEHVVDEIYQLCRLKTYSPLTLNHLKPDLETDEFIIEVKTGSFFTRGTANEKILGSPFKYANVPVIYNKPLVIVCVGGAEAVCRNSYGNLRGKASDTCKDKFVEFYKQNLIEYTGATDLVETIFRREQSG
jgi:hypothetical protein